MSQIATFRELFAHSAWARGRLLDAAESLSGAQLDQPFAMGEGSLRKTLFHLWASEFGWLNRWQPQPQPYSDECRGESIAEIRRRFDETAAAREAWLATRTDESLLEPVTYINKKGLRRTFTYAQMLLHLPNHGFHHRAQALGMLRQLGSPLAGPGLDYLFFLRERPAPDAYSREVLCEYYRYDDWAQRRVFALTTALDRAALDRPFELGRGTLRTTLAHTRLAEEWWLENWTLGSGRPFPETDPAISLPDLAALYEKTADERNAFLAERTDAELSRPVQSRPRPDITRVYPLGATMIQLCGHGTHHRAQALNMLRHLGVSVPGFDYVAMIVEETRQEAATR